MFIYTYEINYNKYGVYIHTGGSVAYAPVGLLTRRRRYFTRSLSNGVNLHTRAEK